MTCYRRDDSVASDEEQAAAARGRVVVVDDLPANVRLSTTYLEREGYAVSTAADGIEALAVVRSAQPDLVLMDVRMPKLDGFEACRALKQDPSTRLIPIILVTALADVEDRIRGIEAGADDFITKPINVHEMRARIRSLIRIKRYTDELDSAEAVIVSLALMIEARDPYTNGHCQRLAGYAATLGRSLDLPDDDLAALTRGGFLHDVGKVGIPDAILGKPSRLTAGEFELMKQHTVIGDRLCGELRSLRAVRPIVRHHHERIDGSGYPDGLAHESIPLLAQLMGIVDVFDALTTERPYKTAMGADDACDELRREVQRGWRRSDLVERWIQIVPTLEAARA